MRIAAVLLGALAAFTVAANAASPSQPLGYDDARHLLARTGFGPTDTEVRAFAALTRADAVARLLADTPTIAITAPPVDVAESAALPAQIGRMSAEERAAYQRAQVRLAMELRGWWIGEMLATRSPLTERMTLFWHNHFVSSQQKVRSAQLMYRQNALLRANALGRFDALLHAIARDPAMVIYLDSAQNRKGVPNENFAREAMELFTLGEGHYSERDIKEAARAFTGWSIDRQTGTFRFRPALHDDDAKTLFGTQGRFDGDAVLDMLLERAQTSVFIVSKLWREFVSPQPDERDVQRIARRFRDSHYDIRIALGDLLTSDAFYAPENRGVLVKSPVELVVGTLRQLQLAPDDARPFALAAAAMGQALFAPPNVKGWPGGDAWINTQTLLARKQFIDRVTRADEPRRFVETLMRESDATAAMQSGGSPDADATRPQPMGRTMIRGVAPLHFDSARFLASFPGSTPQQRSRAVQRLLLATDPVQPVDFDADSSTLVRALALDAAYQLK